MKDLSHVKRSKIDGQIWQEYPEIVERQYAGF